MSGCKCAFVEVDGLTSSKVVGISKCNLCKAAPKMLVALRKARAALGNRCAHECGSHGSAEHQTLRECEAAIKEAEK